MSNAVSGLFGDAFGAGEGQSADTPAATSPDQEADEEGDEPTFPAEPEPEPTPATEAPVEPEPEPAGSEPAPKMVPLSALEALRRENQALKRAQYAPPPEPVARPSVYDDPDQWEQSIDERLAATEVNLRFSVSERFAIREHGAEKVAEAKAWAVSQDPVTRQAILQAEDPIGETVARFKRDQLLQRIGDDEEAFIRRRAAEMGLIGAAPPQPAPAGRSQSSGPSAAPPRRSIASVAGSAGAGMGDAPGSALEGLKFKLDR